MCRLTGDMCESDDKSEATFMSGTAAEDVGGGDGREMGDGRRGERLGGRKRGVV